VWLAVVVCVCLGGLPWHGRALAGDRPPKMADHPLPKYFDKLGLTAEQQQKVCAVMDEYDDEIERHLEQLRKLRGKPYATSLLLAHVNAVKKLRGQRAAALEKLLTDEQRARLKELRAADEADKNP
jgi:Spy/CpxP family protein refolding chaperone